MLLSACATQTMDQGLPQFTGHSIETAINYLGVPDAEQKIAGRKVYTWGHQESGSYIMPVTSPTTYTAYGPGGVYTARGSTTSYVPQMYNYNCAIKMIVNKKEVIQSAEYQGNEGGCEYYASGIDRFLADLELEAKNSSSPSKKKKN